MSLATIVSPSARKPTKARRIAARLLLVIAGRSYRFWPHVFDRSLAVEEKHVFRGPDGRTFAVFEVDFDMEEMKAALLNDRRIPPKRFHCEACGVGRCDHVEALVGLGIL
jgi:hypothetical protein